MSLDALKQALASKHGELIIQDVEKLARAVRIDNREPNANAAIYKVALIQLLQRWSNLIEQKQGDANQI